MRSIISLILLAFLVGCGQSEKAEPVKTSAPAEQATSPPPTVTEPAVPAASAQTQNQKQATAGISTPPIATASQVGTAPDAARGATTYATLCATCHGPTGAGDGPAAAALDPKPAHHNDPVFMATLTDDILFKVIKGGGPAVGKSPLMPPWGATLSDDQVRDVIAFMRTLSQPK